MPAGWDPTPPAPPPPEERSSSKANAEAPPPPENLPFYLHDLLQKWLVRNKELTVRPVLPIVQGGNTVAIHVWSD